MRYSVLQNGEHHSRYEHFVIIFRLTKIKAVCSLKQIFLLLLKYNPSNDHLINTNAMCPIGDAFYKNNMFLYSTVSNHQGCSKCFTLYSLAYMFTTVSACPGRSILLQARVVCHAVGRSTTRC